jgi:signal transduction histidine kinase
MMLGMSEERSHILVVDDNVMNRLKLMRGLEQEGYAVTTAEDGSDALQKLGAQVFDVVLLDIMMPVMDGYQVLEQMKRTEALRDIPVIVISAVDEMDSVAHCIEMGAEDYLPKTFDPVLLRARLRASLQKKKLRDLERAYLQQEVMLRQSEKLATLGRLSAGMAHELNNPSAAVLSGVKQLRTVTSELQQSHYDLAASGVTSDQLATLAALGQTTQERAVHPDDLDPLLLSDRALVLETWLEEQGVADSWRFSTTLVNLDFDVTRLEALAADFPPGQLAAVIAWLNCTYTLYCLLEEIGQGAGHITHIVRALKSYTYLDQAPVQSVNVHEGLDNTLVMLRSKLRGGVIVHREYAPDLPPIEAYGSELNQVWTNIIDNAVDAMQGRGEITLRTRHDAEWVIVEIEDNGPGIPEAVQPRIFDPFVTTKAPGHGTGLGLNISHNIIVQKHQGSITVDSRPGRTRFEIRLPLHRVITQ